MPTIIILLQQYSPGRITTCISVNHKWHFEVSQVQKPEGYITVHKANQMHGLSQHPISKVAWDLQGLSAVQQCQHNDKYIMHSSLLSQETTTLP